MDLAAFIVSVVALVVSGWSIRYARVSADAGRRQASAAEDVLALERKRRADEEHDRAEALHAAGVADLRVIRYDDGEGLRIRLVNHGPAIAHHVTGEVVATSDGGPIPPMRPRAIAADHLHPGDHAEGVVIATWQQPEAVQLSVHWHDEHGPHIERVDLHL